MIAKKILNESLNVSNEIWEKARKAVADAWKKVTGEDFDEGELTLSALRDTTTGDVLPIAVFDMNAVKKVTELLVTAYLAPAIADKSVIYHYGYGDDVVGKMPSLGFVIGAITTYFYYIPAVSIRLEQAKVSSPFSIEQSNINLIQGCSGLAEEDILIFLAALKILSPIDSAQSKYYAEKSDDFARHKKEEDKIAKRQEKAAANLKEIEAAIASGAMKNADGYWGALGYLAAATGDSRVTTRISATVPEAKPGKIDWVTWFGNNYPDDLDALNIRKVLKKKSAISGKEWDNIYGPIFELHISKKAVASAPEFLYSGLAGTANPIFASKSDTAGALREDGTISNLIFIAKLVNDHGFKFSAPYVPTLEELLATVPDQYKDAVKAGYDKGIAVLNAYATDEDENSEDDEIIAEFEDAAYEKPISDVDIDDALNQLFPDPEDTNPDDPDLDESFEEEDLPDDPFLVDYENELMDYDKKVAAQKEVDEIEADLDEGINEKDALVRAAKVVRAINKK